MLEAAARKGAEKVLGTFLENHTGSILAGVSVDASEGVSTDMPCKYNERVEVGRKPDGKPNYKWAGGNTKQELHFNIARLIAGYQSEIAVNNQPASDSTRVEQNPQGTLFEGYALEWLETFKLVGLEEKTKHVYRSRMKCIIAEFGDMPIVDITSAGIQKWLNRLAAEGKAKSTLRDTLNLFKQCLSAAVEDGLIGSSPANSKRITNPSKKVEKREALSEDQWRDVVLNIHRLEDANDRRFMAILSFTSLRPGEVRALRWEDFDFERRYIDIQRAVSCATNQPIIKDTKTENGVRLNPLPDALVDFLAPLNTTGYVIAREDGSPYTEQTHKRAWERIKRTINVHGMTPYNWRHTYATTMIHSGIDLDTAKALMGHADTRMTMKYVHTQPQHIAKAAAIINAHFVQTASGMWTEDAAEKCHQTLAV